MGDYSYKEEEEGKREIKYDICAHVYVFDLVHLYRISCTVGCHVVAFVALANKATREEREVVLLLRSLSPLNLTSIACFIFIHSSAHPGTCHSRAHRSVKADV